MSEQVFTPVKVDDSLISSVSDEKRGTAISVFDMYPTAARKILSNAQVHDANFAFYTTSLAKLHNVLYEPKYFVTYSQDIPVDVGGGFVDFVNFYSVDYAGIMDEFRNVTGNNANYIPRVNAGLTKTSVPVYTWQVAYDLRFVELEKMKKLDLAKSIQEIYSNIIVAGWDLFVQKVAYTGLGDNAQGLFNHDGVETITIDNTGTTGSGFEGLSDSVIVSFFNGIFEHYLTGSNMNLSLLPDTILVPTFVGKDLSSRFSALYTSSLRSYLVANNLAVDESAGTPFKLTIASRPALDTLGAAGKGRIVAYRKDKQFVRIDMPYPMQHYITLPNIERMSYTSAFVGQVSGIELPYNTDDSTLGVVTYFDFTK